MSIEYWNHNKFGKSTKELSLDDRYINNSRTLKAILL